MRTYDFRRGKNGWGHALHSDTWKFESPREVSVGWFKKPNIIARASVLVHCGGYPSQGDQIVFTGNSGQDRVWNIRYAERCGNVDDMYKLYLEDVKQYTWKEFYSV